MLLTLAQEIEPSFWESVTAHKDTFVYLIIACIFTLLMVIRIVFMLVFGLDDGMDIDMGGLDAHGDVPDMGDGGGGVGFSFLSVFSIFSFFMGFGWMGFVARFDWGMNSVPSAVLAMLFGICLMMLAGWGLFLVRRLDQGGDYNINDAVGKIGRVYLRIPGGGHGTGEAEVTVSNRKKVLPAKTRGDHAIESFTTVKVIEVEGNHTLIVEPC